MELICYRHTEIKHEPRLLPAATYNLLVTLLMRSITSSLLIPIRSMQYLAIFDQEELVFLDGERRCWIDVAWRHFKPQQRHTLDEAVAYEAVYYQEDAEQLMPRLQSELPQALRTLSSKSRIASNASVIKFPTPSHAPYSS